MKAAAALLSILSAAAFAQAPPAMRVIPESPRASHRVYLEIGLTPCRVVNSSVQTDGASVRVVTVSTGLCNATAPDTGNFVVPLGLVPAGLARVDVSLDGVSRSIAYTVASAEGAAFVDISTIVAEGARADHSMDIFNSCFHEEVVLANDSRTEIVVDYRAAYICPATPPLLPPVRIGFPRPGYHLVVVKYEGIVRVTQLITVAKGFDKLDYSDLWDVEGESGWGVTIMQHESNRVVAVLFGFRPGGRPLWLSMPGPDWESPTHFSGPLVLSAGTSGVGTFDASKSLVRGPVGTASFDFGSADTAVLKMIGFDSSLGLPAERSWTLKRNKF